MLIIRVGSITAVQDLPQRDVGTIGSAWYEGHSRSQQTRARFLSKSLTQTLHSNTFRLTFPKLATVIQTVLTQNCNTFSSLLYICFPVCGVSDRTGVGMCNNNDRVLGRDSDDRS